MIQNYMPTEYTKHTMPKTAPDTVRPLPEHDPQAGQKEFNTVPGRKSVRKKSVLITKLSAILLSVVLVKDGFGEDILASNPFADSISEPTVSESVTPGNSATPTPITSKEPDTEGEVADTAFPSLTNLAINTQLGEAFVSVKEVDTAADYTLFNQFNPDSNVAGPKGISYDEDTNTLTLNNVNGNYMIFVNIMGNSFKLNVQGENHIASIVVYGYYYAGSMLITGDGSLYLNEDQLQYYGIHMEGEYSQSCLMIDNSVEIHANGAYAAIMVHASTMDKGIYYLAPLSVKEGQRERGVYEIQSISGVTEPPNGFDYTFVDDEGYVLHTVDIE